MSTELAQDASAGAAPVESQGQTAQPEPQTAGDAHQQTETEQSSDQSSDEGGGDKLTPEQRKIQKLERRIDRLTAKRGAAEREAELRRQELEAIQQRISRQDDDGEPAKRQFTEADIDRIARERADELTRQRAIGDRVGKVLKEGSKLDGFNAAVDAVAEVVPFMDKRGKPTPFIEAVLDADNPAELLKYLGDNPEEAEELADLTPARLGAAPCHA
jgi:chromosome segregation ATPase